MSSEYYEKLEDNLTNLVEEIKTKITRRQHCNGEEKKRITAEINRIIESADGMLNEMEAEMKKAPYPFRNELQKNVRLWRDDVKKLSVKVREEELSHSKQRRVLFEEDDSIMPIVNNQRSRLMQTNDILSRTSDSIVRSHVVAAETDQIGTEIIEELGTQRESLIRTKDRLADTDSNLTRSRRLLKAMYRRVITNKIILIVVIILEIFILLAIIYLKYIK